MRGKPIIGALALCMLAMGVVGAGNASATGLGLTAFTCTNEGIPAGTGKYKTNHCETPEEAGNNFETVEITPGISTEIEGKSEGKQILKGKLLTVEIEITCNNSVTTGKLTNVPVNAGEEHRIHGTEVSIHYTECIAHLVGKPEEKCEIENLTEPGKGNKGTISTNKVTFTTGANHIVTLTPENEGKVFSEFKVIKSAGCNLPATLSTKVTGETTALANTTKHSHLTLNPAEGTGKGLTAFTNPATYEGTNATYMAGTENTIGATTVTPRE